jgi:hypothetical protein
MDQLVDEALEFAKVHPDPIEKVSTDDRVSLEPSQISQIEEAQSDIEVLSEDEEGELNPAEDFRQLGNQIEALLLDGEEIDD